NSINIANNKYELMRISQKLGVPTPKFKIVKTNSELLNAFEEFGEKFVVKPPVSSGMRGFRIVSDKASLTKEAFYNQKPDNVTITKEELLKILGEDFPPLLVMEFLPGKEYTVDVLSRKGKCYCIVPRSRDMIRSGITFAGTVVKRGDLISYSSQLTENIGLEFAHGYQFKEDEMGVPKIIESNPRIQGTMVLATLANANLIYASIKIALGEKLPEFNVKWDTKLIRYWGAIGISDGKIEKV
ncbi:MAG: ATP-grasp domain-containing protein, partial [Thermoplasmata archaeon]